ncbi:hypothetical protein OJ252_1874 [Cryptosporidium canis]|uniref:Uncharacterized protein n=1 Tax=Cryptosporidium canis TaxID=195482 RepID=A0ABQ8P6S9_9CRYT|nr:hypothetical protein OJ252_1874 [Cryptosporidium canis]
MKFMFSILIILLTHNPFFALNHQINQSSFDEAPEYITYRELKRTFHGCSYNMNRFGKKKGKIEQIVNKLPHKKKPIIITSDWSQEDYMVISFIIFLSRRLDTASRTFDIKKYKNWIFGNVPPLEELSRGSASFEPLPDWSSWWKKEGSSIEIFQQIGEIYSSIVSTPDTFRFSDEFFSKTTRPFLSLIYIFSREMASDNAQMKNIPKSSYREEVIKHLEAKKEEILPEFNTKSTRLYKEQSLKFDKGNDTKNGHLSLIRKAYNHVLSVKKRRKFNSENGDNIELLPNWWEKELDIITAIILTIFKYQYRHRMKIIESENKTKHENINWKGIKRCLKQTISCTSNGASDNSLEHIPIWHRFGEKWQSFPQGAMIRILDNVSKLSLTTKGWDVYDYVICLCFYYLIKRERIRMDWFTLGPLSGSPKTRHWRRFKRFINKIFSSNNGSTTNEIILEINNKVRTKYPDLNIPDAWETRVFIKYYPNESSIKVHCPVESDAPFGRVLIRNLFRIYKHKFPTDNNITKMKLSFQPPLGGFITAKELSDKGYLPTLNELVENLIEEDTRNDLPSASSSILPITKLSLSSLSSSVSNVHSCPIYIFYTNEDEKLKQEGMVQLLVQLGFNVVHILGNPPIAVESLNIPSAAPEILSPVTGYNKTLDEENTDI